MKIGEKTDGQILCEACGGDWSVADKGWWESQYDAGITKGLVTTIRRQAEELEQLQAENVRLEAERDAEAGKVARLWAAADRYFQESDSGHRATCRTYAAMYEICNCGTDERDRAFASLLEESKPALAVPVSEAERKAGG